MRPLRLKFAAARVVDRYFIQPRREKVWATKSQPFTHTNDIGLRFSLQPGEYVDSEIFLHGFYERRFLELLRSVYRHGGTAVDIGANIGNHAVFFGQIFDRVHAFEPNPSVLPRLNRNVALNNLQGKVNVHPVGLGKERARLPFRDNGDGNLGGSGFLHSEDELRKGDRVRELQIEKGDDFVAEFGLTRLDFIKIDVEGWEPEVFEGLAKTIERLRPVIAFEHHAQEAPADDFSRIRACLPGYLFAEARFAAAEASAVEKLRWNLKHGAKPEIHLFETPESRSYENVLALPDEESLAMFRKA